MNGLLKISGEGAKALLQGQFTCDVNALSPSENCLGAQCNPQGRILSLFRLFFHENNYYLSLPQEMVPFAEKDLKKYAPFFKVTLSEANDMLDIINNKINKLDDIQAGIPAIYPETREKFLPHELNLHKLNAISFNKGCYTGQEIIARMHYKGKLKTRLCQRQIIADNPPKRGEDIYRDNKPCGYIVDYALSAKNTYVVLVLESI